MGNRNVFASTSGASIIIALSMIGAIMFFTIGMTSTMIMAITNTADSKKAVQAEYAAQSGVELANLALKTVEPATIVSPATATKCFDGSSSCATTSYAKYTVYSKDTSPYYNSSPFSYYRSVPVRATGNAATSCVAEINPNDPCHWNKLYFGDSISIPLYYISGTTSYGPSTTLLNMYFLRIRTPCEPGSTGPSCDRYPIFGSNDSIIGVTLSTTGDETCVVGSCTATATISANSINTYNSTSYQFKVFSYTSNVQDPTNPSLTGSVNDFIKNKTRWALNSNTPLRKFLLKFSYIKTLDGDGVDIPYLEYQFLYYSYSKALAASYKVVTEGYSNGFKFSLNGVQGLGSGLFDFAVQN